MIYYLSEKVSITNKVMAKGDASMKKGIHPELKECKVFHQISEGIMAQSLKVDVKDARIDGRQHGGRTHSSARRKNRSGRKVCCRAA